MGKRPHKGSGATWLYPTTRWALYLRDGLQCVYCQVTLDELLQDYDDNFLTIDHAVARAKNGTNDPSNLVTCCYACNVSKRKLSVKQFCREMGYNYDAVRSRSLRRRKKDVEQYREAAKVLLGLTDWGGVHHKVVDHDFLVKRQWAGEANIDQQHWEHLRLQQELWCPTCSRILPSKGEDAPVRDDYDDYYPDIF